MIDCEHSVSTGMGLPHLAQHKRSLADSTIVELSQKRHELMFHDDSPDVLIRRGQQEVRTGSLASSDSMARPGRTPRPTLRSRLVAVAMNAVATISAARHCRAIASPYRRAKPNGLQGKYSRAS